MTLLMTLLLGLVVGAVASWIMRSQNGILMDIVLGIVGAFAGSLIMNLLGYGGVNGFNLYSFLVSLVGAIVVIYAGRLFTRNTRTSI